MSITILFIELIIIGVQVLTWIALLVFTQFDLAYVSLFLSTLGIEMLLILLICFGYCLGIFMDRIADAVFARWNQKLKDSIIPNPTRTYGSNIGTMRYMVVENNAPLNNFLDYTRSRMRIARATALNIPLITVLLLVFGVSKNLFALVSGLSLIILILGIGITLTSIFTWRNLTVRHLDLIKTTYVKQKEKENGKKSGSNPD